MVGYMSFNIRVLHSSDAINVRGMAPMLVFARESSDVEDVEEIMFMENVGVIYRKMLLLRKKSFCSLWRMYNEN